MSQTTSLKKLLIELIAAMLVLLFVYTATSKLLHFSQFEQQLSKSPYTEKIAGLLSWLLPITEFVVAMLLVFKKTRLAGLYGSFFLMVLFTAYIYSMLHYSSYVPCSCGGVLASLSWDQHFWFNIFFMVLALAGILFTITNKVHRNNPPGKLATA